MRQFTATASGYMAPIGRDECELLSRFCGELIDILEAPVLDTAFVNAHIEEESERPEPMNVVLQRLLPIMSDDSSVAAQLRALTEDDLRAQKSERLAQFVELLDEAAGTGFLLVEPNQVDACLGALTDMRLALAAPLQIESSANAEQVEELGLATLLGNYQEVSLAQERRVDPYLASTYVALTWWQASLLDAAEAPY